MAPPCAPPVTVATGWAEGGRRMPDILVKADRVIGEDTVRTALESTCALPRPAARVVDVVASLRDLTSTVQADLVQITATLREFIYYVGPGDRVYQQTEDVPVTALAGIPGAEPGMVARVRGIVTGVTRALTGAYQVNQTATLEFFVKVTQTQQSRLALATAGPLYMVDRIVGENTMPSVVEAASELPVPALEIRDIVVTLNNVSCEVLTNQVIVRGSVIREIFYVSTDNAERYFQEEVPFTQAIPMDGARAGMKAQVAPRIERVDREVGVSTAVNHRVALATYAQASEAVQVRLATCPTGPLFRVDRVVAENAKQVMIESAGCLAEPASSVRNIHVTVTELALEILRNRVIIQGVLHQQIFYVGAQDVVQHQVEDVPFCLFADTPGARPGMNVQVTPTVEYVQYQLVADGSCPPTELPEEDLLQRGLHQRVVAEFFIKVTEEAQIRAKVAEIVTPQ